MSPGHELFGPLPIVENLAVEDDDHRPILVEDRLGAAGEIDNRQAAVAQPDVAVDEESVAVGAAVRQCAGHPGERVRRHLAAGGFDETADAAHLYVRPEG